MKVIACCIQTFTNRMLYLMYTEFFIYFCHTCWCLLRWPSTPHCHSFSGWLQMSSALPVPWRHHSWEPRGLLQGIITNHTDYVESPETNSTKTYYRDILARQAGSLDKSSLECFIHLIKNLRWLRSVYKIKCTPLQLAWHLATQPIKLASPVCWVLGQVTNTGML